jgi:hypothetical protein
MSAGFTTLEQRILVAKGLSEEQLVALIAAGVGSRADFATIGDATTLRQLLPGLGEEVAADVMAWGLAATGGAANVPGDPAGGGTYVLDSPDTVYCVHCHAKQPKDYHSGDLCVACGKQAEPILSCFWCASSGPGTFCRQCGAEFVPTAELDLAILLKREGAPKDTIADRLRTMSAPDKDVLWGRVRKSRG